MFDILIQYENDLRLLIAAPTVPIYEITNLPQDAVECQLAIGSDDSLNWYSSGSWHTIADGGVTINSVPQDVVEGQIVVCLDGTGIAWFSNGNWHAAAGTSTSGNPPQDAIEGQIAIGNSDNLCYYSNGQWYTL